MNKSSRASARARTPPFLNQRIFLAGSIVAFGKLAGMMDSKPLSLPGRDQLNLAMLATCALGMAAFLDPALAGTTGMAGDAIQLGSLGVAAAVSSLLGWHLTASIGKYSVRGIKEGNQKGLISCLFFREQEARICPW